LYPLSELFIHVLEESPAERRLLNVAKSRIKSTFFVRVKSASDLSSLVSGTAAATWSAAAVLGVAC
jgi:hypothetical protein